MTQIENLMKHLGCTKEEAEDIIQADKAIDQGKPTSFDLPKEKEKEALKEAHKGKTIAYNFTKRERKPDVTKENFVQVLADFLNDKAENVNITNKNRQVAFDLDGDSYELTLVKKRKPKK